MSQISKCINPQFQSPLNRASKDKFYMVFTPPYILKQLYKDDSNITLDPLQISVFGAIVPTIAVPSVEVRYYGQSTNVSSYSRPNYPPLNVSFVVDNDYRNYYVLWKWLAILNDPAQSVYAGSDKHNIDMGDSFEYQADVSIFALDEYNEPSIEFKYTKCFITSLGELNYSYREGELIETAAQFQFNQLFINALKK